MASSGLYQSLGNFISIERTSEYFKIKGSNAFLFLKPFDSGLWQVQIQKVEQLVEFSYAVILDGRNTDYEIQETPNELFIEDELIKIKINKSPLRIEFQTKDGKVINADDEGLGHGQIGEAVVAHKQVQKNEKFIGLGEKSGPFLKNGASYTNWNSDVFGYATDADPLYATLPFYLGIHDAASYGIFFDNSHKSKFNFGASNNRFISFSADAGIMNYYFIYDDSVRGIINKYGALTGRMDLPSKWSLGLQQCRYSYYPDHELKSVADNYRNREIPCDVMYYDIHYMDAYKVFTWDNDRFPDPEGLNKYLNDNNFRTVCIIDPGVKTEKGYHAYEDGIEKDVFVKYPDGINYEAQVWPGWCHFPDFTNEKTRDWWAGYISDFAKTGINGFWNDMNEPASWGQDSPDVIEFDFESDKTSHREAHNIYGMQMARATLKGADDALDNERPFVLTRAAYAGIQRYAALWTGDNSSSDDHLLMGARMIANLGLAGIPFCGYDTGGFVGDTSPYLFARWIQTGAFSPFFRIHKMVNSKDSEPWTYGEEVEAIAGNFIRLRYRLMPYIYSAMYEASQSSLPLCRSLAIDYPHAEEVYQSDFENQYLFGDAILVCPQKSETTIAKVWLPEGDWYFMYNDQKFEGGKVHLMDCPPEIIPLFVKAGSVIPMQSQTQYWNDQHDETLYLHVYPSKEDCVYTFYDDDGISKDYKKEAFAKRAIKLTEKGLSISKQEGNYQSPFKKLRVYVHGKASDKANKETVRFIEPLPNFDPFYTPIKFIYECDDLGFQEMEFGDGEIIVDF